MMWLALAPCCRLSGLGPNGQSKRNATPGDKATPADEANETQRQGTKQGQRIKQTKRKQQRATTNAHALTLALRPIDCLVPGPLAPWPIVSGLFGPWIFGILALWSLTLQPLGPLVIVSSVICVFRPLAFFASGLLALELYEFKMRKQGDNCRVHSVVGRYTNSSQIRLGSQWGSRVVVSKRTPTRDPAHFCAPRWIVG